MASSKVGGRVFINDRGMKQFTRKIALLSRKRVSVGIVEDTPTEGGGDFSMADLLSVHEFGTLDGRIDERKPMRHALEKNQDKYLRMLDTATDRVLLKTATATGELLKLGEEVRKDIIMGIRNDELGFPLADSTIAAKGSSLPLLDTGALVGSIKAVVR